MRFLLVLFGILAAANAISFFDLVQEEWTTFKVTIHKLYIIIQYKLC